MRRFDCSFIFTYPVQTSVGRTCCCWLLSLLILSVPRVLLDSPGPSRALPTRSAPVCVLVATINTFRGALVSSELILCRKNGGDLEQIKFLLGHSSIQTTERYLGSEQDIEIAVNDNLGL